MKVTIIMINFRNSQTITWQISEFSRSPVI